MGETMLRVDNVKKEDDLEAVRDALDELGAVYEHVDSEPDEDTFPQTASFKSSPISLRTPTYFWSDSPKSAASTPRSSERPSTTRAG